MDNDNSFHFISNQINFAIKTDFDTSIFSYVIKNKCNIILCFINRKCMNNNVVAIEL